MEDLTAGADERRSQHAACRALRYWLAPVVFCVLAATSLNGAPASPSPTSALEYQVKAAFVYNFAKFVEWPGDAGATDAATLIIGVIGEDPFGQTLDDTVRGKTVGGRALAIKRFTSIDDLEPCQVLFVSASLSRHLPEILSRIQGSPTLTISEEDRFAQDGGMVRLVTEDNKIRFEINVDAAERAGLRISSKLLALAQIVHGRDKGGH